MNRRALMVGTVALASSGHVTAQATPEQAIDPGQIMTKYIADVITANNPDAVADYFDGEALDLRRVRQQHVILLDGIVTDRTPFDVDVLATNERAAVAYGVFHTDDGDFDMFLMLSFGADGKATWYRAMSDPAR